MARPRTTGSVSLFPFLAVLICAMGALILLLVVVTWQIRTETVARARHEDQTHQHEAAAPAPPPAIPEPLILPELVVEPPVDPNVELQARATRLEDEIAAARAELARRQAILQVIHEEADRTAAEIRDTEIQLAEVSAERRRQSEASAALEERQRQIDSEVRGLSGRIAQVRQQAAQAPSRFAFVPYDGRSGTARRPILIECTEQGLRFIPEDVLITEADLDGFLLEYNPLLAAAEALAEYWSLRDRQDGGVAREPYFLAIVRPGGARGFYVAQKILGRTSEQFGYELLTDDFPLAVPEVDPRARIICRTAVDRILAERDRLLTSLRQGRLSSPAGTVLRAGSGGADRSVRAAAGSGGFSGTAEVVRGNGTATGIGGIGSTGVVGADPSGGPFPGGAGRFGESQANGGIAPAGLPGNSGVPAPDLRPSAFGDDHGPLIQPGRGRSPGVQRSGALASGELRGSQPQEGFAQGGGLRNAHGTWPPEAQSAVGAGASPAPAGTLSGNRSPAGGFAGPRGTGTASGAAADPDAGGGFPSFAGANRSSADDRGLSPQFGAGARRGAIGLEKEVLVEVLPDRLIVGRELLVPAGDDDPLKRITEELVEALERHVLGWGEPPANFYWAPRVKFRVGQGANRQYERIRGPVERMGLPTTAQFVLETEPGSRAR